MGVKNGCTREEREYRVVVLPAGPEQEGEVSRETLFKGSLERATEYYEAVRQELVDVPAGSGVALVDGFGTPVYACS